VNKGVKIDIFKDNTFLLAFLIEGDTQVGLLTGDCNSEIKFNILIPFKVN
jgi:hypothetical protein